MTCSQGWQTSVYMKVSSSSGISPDALITHVSTDQIDFLSEDFKISDRYQDDGDIRGKREQFIHSVRLAGNSITGQLKLLACPGTLLNFLRYVTGSTSSPYTPQDTLDELSAMVRKIGVRRQYNQLVCAGLTLEASQGGPFIVTSNYVGKTEVENPTSDPALLAAYPSQYWNPYMLSDAVVTIGGTAVGVAKVSLKLDNVLSVNTLNSLAPTNICTQGSIVTLSLTSLAADLRAALYDTSGMVSNGLGKPPGVIAQITLTHPLGSILVIDCVNWVIPRTEGGTSGRGDINTTFSGRCYGTIGTNSAVKFTYTP